jgi:predicted cupin superfamily sugar epimerase
MPPTTQTYIDALEMLDQPEGGFFREIYPLSLLQTHSSPIVSNPAHSHHS